MIYSQIIKILFHKQLIHFFQMSRNRFLCWHLLPHHVDETQKRPSCMDHELHDDQGTPILKLQLVDHMHHLRFVQSLITKKQGYYIDPKIFPCPRCDRFYVWNSS